MMNTKENQFPQFGLSLPEQLKTLKSKHDWLGIYRKFQPITQLPQHDSIWNNSQILSDIGFVCAKLAETGPKELLSFRNQNHKNDFLKQQAEYRKYAMSTRKHCIEIAPKHAGYRSDLAYTYYQNINELTQPRGRRDGNPRKEIDEKRKPKRSFHPGLFSFRFFSPISDPQDR